MTPERNNGFADNWWGVVCRSLRDLINAFDVNPLALVAFLVIDTMIMAWFHSIFDWFKTPDWWVGPTGVLFLMVITIMGKHTVGYYIASRLNSEKGQPPVIGGSTSESTDKRG